MLLIPQELQHFFLARMHEVLHFHPALAPVKIGVLPLSKKLNEGAEKIFAQLSKKYNCEFDDRGNIGKRYRRQDEIGTPFCVTYDFESEEDGAVTVRDRDTMQQESRNADASSCLPCPLILGKFLKLTELLRLHLIFLNISLLN